MATNADAFRETPDRSRRGSSATLGSDKGGDRRAQRRGAPLLPGQALNSRTRRPTRRTRSATARPASGSAASPSCRATLGSRRSTTSRRRRTTSRAPATTRDSSSPGLFSDFSLMDAIESGIVKVPRIPVDDDADGRAVDYLHLWDNIQPPLPKRDQAKELGHRLAPARGRSKARCAASTAATRRRSRTGRASWRALASRRRCSSSSARTRSSRSSSSTGSPASRASRTATAVALSRASSSCCQQRRGRQAGRRGRARILIDSAQLESGEALERRLQAGRRRARSTRSSRSTASATPAPTSTSSTDSDLLREVMNTVGKQGKLGEQIRCVVSVSMLTEGWDANTVTHILGVRAFGSQLLCEQVVGRGLRRRSYASTRRGCFEPEYAESTASRSQFIPSDKPVPSPMPPRPAIEVRALPRARGAARSSSRSSTATGSSSPTSDSTLDLDDDVRSSQIDPDTVSRSGSRRAASSATSARRSTSTQIRDARPQEVAFALAKRIARRRSSRTRRRRAALALPAAGRDLPGLARRVRDRTDGYDLGLPAC